MAVPRVTIGKRGRQANDDERAARALEIGTANRARAAASTSNQAPVATPLVRKIAKDADVALASVTGTGAGGRITRADVTTAVARQGGSLPPAQAAPARQSPEDALYELVYGSTQASVTSAVDRDSLDALVAEAERTA